jgi:hypothetical protein
LSQFWCTSTRLFLYSVLLLNIFSDPLDTLHDRGIFATDDRIFNENSGCIPLVDPELPIKYVVLKVIIETDPLHIGVSCPLRQLFQREGDRTELRLLLRLARVDKNVVYRLYWVFSHFFHDNLQPLFCVKEGNTDFFCPIVHGGSGTARG